MLSLYDQLPRYLLGKYQLTMTVVSTALFSLIFIIVCLPFLDNSWFRIGQDAAFPYTVAFLVLSVLIIVISKRLMYQMRNARDFTFLTFILWSIAEILIISVLYTVFTIEGDRFGLLNTGGQAPEDIFWRLLVSAAICLGVPCVVCSLYFAVEDKDNTIRLMNYSNVVSDVPYTPSEEKRITLFDNNGVLKFSISTENLFFIESDDNYIKVWYTDNSGEMKRYMLRCRLKTVEDSFTDSNLMRCHRKYIVNISKVKILKAEKDGYQINLDIENVDPIPISKTYEQAVLSRFNNHQ